MAILLASVAVLLKNRQGIALWTKIRPHPPLNATRLYTPLHVLGIPTELRIFKNGGHGFGIERAASLSARKWRLALTRDRITHIALD